MIAEIKGYEIQGYFAKLQIYWIRAPLWLENEKVKYLVGLFQKKCFIF